MAFRESFSTVLAATALVIGCGTGTRTATDTGPLGPELPPLTRGTIDVPDESAAAYACRGATTEPVAGGDVDVTMNLRFFQADTEARNVRVWFFRDNVIRDTCEAGLCEERISGTDDGSLRVTGRAGGWYAYRVFELDGPTDATTVVPSFQYNEPTPASAGVVEGNAVELSAINLIPALLGGPRTPDTALVAGTVLDCEEQPVRGATIRMYDPRGAQILEGEAVGAPHFRYFNGNSFPDGVGVHTHVDGLYVGVNIEVPAAPSDLIRVEAWGRASADDPPQGRLLGCEAMRIFQNAVTIINVGPLRNDYPAGHPCAGART